jgi:hypothetical protein
MRNQYRMERRCLGSRISEKDESKKSHFWCGEAGLRNREWDKDFGLWGAELISYEYDTDTGVRDDV